MLLMDICRDGFGGLPQPEMHPKTLRSGFLFPELAQEHGTPAPNVFSSVLESPFPLCEW